MSGYDLVWLQEENDWQSYHAIRRTVLFEARGNFNYDPNHEDEYKEGNFPFLLKLSGQGIGTTRLDIRNDNTGVFRLVAIRADLQRQGYGRVLGNMVEDFALNKGIQTLLVNAEPKAIEYYHKLGFALFDWDPTELAGIAEDCRQMRKMLV